MSCILVEVHFYQFNVRLSVWTACRYPLPSLQHVTEWTLRKQGLGNHSRVLNCPVEEKQLSLTVLRHILPVNLESVHIFTHHS